MDTFSPLNLCLSLVGSQLLKTSIWIKIINSICLLLTILCPLYDFIFLVIDLITRLLHSGITRNMLVAIIWRSSYISDYFFVFIMIKNRKKLVRVLKRLTSFISEKDQKALFKLSATAFICSLLFFLQGIIANLVYYFFQDVPETDKNYYNFFRFFTGMWSDNDCSSVTGRFVYCFFIRLITLTEKQFLSNVQQNQSLSPDVVSLQRRKLLAFKLMVQHQFSIMPVLWFMKEFLFCLGSIVSRQSSWSQNHPIFYWIFNVLPILYSLIAHIFLVCFVDYCKQDVDSQIDELTIFLTSQNYKKWKSVIREFDEDKKCHFTAANLFDINKRVALSFVSALITTTVVFEQVMSTVPLE